MLMDIVSGTPDVMAGDMDDKDDDEDIDIQEEEGSAHTTSLGQHNSKLRHGTRYPPDQQDSDVTSVSFRNA